MAERGGVIHDIGYRGYTGRREGTGALARTLYVTGLRNAFGLGRSGRAKVLPFVLVGLVAVPAVVMVAVLTLTRLGRLPVTYADYASQVQVLVSLFAAVQAPVLFTRDLRHQSIVLYAARPLSPGWFAVTRWASLTSAIVLLLFVPAVTLYAGGLLAGLDVAGQTRGFLLALVLELLLAAALAAVTGLVASVALRRGFAVVGSILLLLLGSGFVAVLQAILAQRSDGAGWLGQLFGLASPWSLYAGLAGAWGLAPAPDSPVGAGWAAVYLATALAVVAGCLALLVLRFRKVAAR